MKKEEFYFDSRDNESKIHAVKWIPDNDPVCVVQIIHGMAEYIERYEDFVYYLVERDILVVGEDHLGHGKSVGNNPKGYFCRRDAATVVVRDVHRLKKMIQEMYKGLPYFIFGHSMGSMIARNYICKYGSGIDGVIISATAMPKKSLMILSGILANVLRTFQGPKHVSRLLNQIAFGSYCKRIANHVSVNDWLSNDTQQVKKYDEDPLCGFIFTINGFSVIKDLTIRLFNKSNLEKVPKELPVLFMYGTEDPVGDYGKAVESVYQSFLKMGITDVSIKSYENDRHELLNETDRDVVKSDVYQWINKRISR